MLKRLILLLSLLFVLVPSAAQEDWSVYIFDNINQDILRVYGDGTLEMIDLDSYSLFYSDDGSHVAYCNNIDGSLMIRVVTIDTRSMILDQTVANASDCQIIFSEDGGRIAVGSLNSMTPESGWQLSVFDLEAGRMTAQINTTGGENQLFLMPMPRHFAGDSVIFAEIPWFTEGAPQVNAFTWNLADNTVDPVEVAGWGTQTLDYLPQTDELIWTAVNPELAAGDPGGPMPTYNVLMIYDADGTRMLYHSPDWLIMGADFVNGGRQIALRLLEPFVGTGMPGEQSTRVVLMDRAGTMTDVGNYPSYTEIVPAPGGFVVMWAEFGDSSMPDYKLQHYQNGAFTDLPAPAANNGGITWFLSWGPVGDVPADLQPFPTFS